MNATILVIDDSEDDRRLCQRALKGCGYSLVMAPSAEAGFACIADANPDSERPDLILLDYNMPDMDGLGFMKRLNEYSDPPIPIVMLTGESDAAVAVEVMKNGADDYLIKDIEGRYLMLLPSVVERVMAAYAQREQTRLLRQQTEQLLHKLSVQQIELEMQNDELRRAQVAIEESRDRYANLYDFAPIGYLTLTREVLISEINLVGAALLGKERGKLIHSRFACLVTPEDIDRWHRHFMDMLQCDGRRSFELALRRADGSSFHAQLDCLRLINDGGTTTVRIALTDITERKQAETLLHRNQILMQNSMDGIHIMDMQGNLVEANNAFCQMLGYTRDEMACLNVADWNMQGATEELWVKFRSFAGKSARFETVHRRKDGALVDVEISTSGMEVEGQYFFLVASRDISERKKVEAMLMQRKLVIDTSIDGFWVTDLNGNLLEANQAYANMSGYAVAELVHMRISQLEAIELSPEDVHAHIAEIIAQGYDRFETRHRRKDGHEIDIEISVTYMAEAQLLFAFCRDITGQKLAEEELRVAAAAFETRDAIMITDAAWNIIRVNQAFSDITGYSREEVLGKNQNIMKPMQHDDIACVEILQQSIRDDLWTGEIWDKRKDGQIYPKWMTSTAIRNEQQEIVRYVTIFSDITARKQIEKENLRESDDRFRGTLEQAAVGITHTSLDGYFKQANQTFCKLVGYTRDELLHMSFYDITFPGDREEQDRLFQRLLAGEMRTFSMEKRYVRKDRGIVLANLTVSLLRDADGTPKYTIGVIEDIAERKHAELLAQQFGHLLQNSFNEIYLFDAHNLHFLLTSEGAEQNLGYSSDELNQLTLLDLELSFTRESFEQMIAPLLSGEQQSLFYETIYLRKDGTTYPVEVRLQLMQAEHPVFLSIVQDITERKQAMDALSESESRFRNLVETTSDFIWEVDGNAAFIYASPKIRDILGYEAAEVIGKTPFDFMHPEEAKRVADIFALIAAAGEPLINLENTNLHKDGHPVVLETSGVPVINLKGQVCGYRGMDRDITERKQADVELNRSRNLLRELAVQSEAFREEERKCLAREVHDELGQLLTALRMKVSLLRIQFGEHNAALLNKIEGITELLDQSIQCVRDVVNNLRPVALDMGIVVAIKWLCDEFIKHTGTPCVVYTPENEIHLDETLAVAAFRVVQESLTNAARYAEASKVEIVIRHDADNFSVTVNDNGKGFDCMAIPSRKSFGLLGMRERAIALGGVVNIYSAPQQGTQVFFTAPNIQSITNIEGKHP